MRPALWFALALLLAPSLANALTTPEAFLKHRVGEDRKLADHGQIVRYFEILDRESPRLMLLKLGKTTLGRDMVMAVISSETNVQNAAAARSDAAKLANPAGLTPEQARALAASGKVIVLVTCSIHSSEIGASQFSMEWAHRLCASQDPRVTGWLDDVILLLMPSINPDGTDMIVDYYRKFLGTEWEGGRLPWLYHHYAGHDNNRDWFMLNLAETRMVNRVLHHEWFPQVFLDMHQMGTLGPRMFVPPNADPVAPVVSPMQWRLNDLFGTNMSFRLEDGGKSGVISSWSYDAYWPGGTKNTACLKNVVGLLTEVASCRIATPVEVDAGELSGGRKGLPDYRQQSNFPNPWPGGRWRLRDIVDYELIAADALLETCSSYREEILRNFHETGRQSIQTGTSEAPFAYVVPAEQRDPSAARQMIAILRENGLQSFVAAESFTAGGRQFAAGSTVFPAAQPYRAFLVEMMERQRYPEVRQGPDTKEIFKPYDVTAWTLPLMMGVDWARVDEPFDVAQSPSGDRGRSPSVDPSFDHVLPASANASYRVVNRLMARGVAVSRVTQARASAADAQPAGVGLGDFIVPATATKLLMALPETLRVPLEAIPAGAQVGQRRLRAPRIGLYKPWAASMDEGWTRLILDQYEFKYSNIPNADMKKKNLRSRFDVILLPDIDKNVIVDGKPKSDDGAYFEPLPSPYAGGIGKDGVASLKAFVEQGGTLVCMTGSCELALEELGLPVRNAVAKLKASEFSLPGTLVNLEVDPSHPLGWGMSESSVAYVTGGPVFNTSIPGANVGRAVVARYPRYADQVVASGWADGTESMTGRGAIVEARLGKGRVVLFGPRVQHRAQMVGTFKFLFNALLRTAVGE